MRIKRLLAGALGTALVATAPLAVSSNAEAVETGNDTVTAVSSASAHVSDEGVDKAFAVSSSSAKMRAAAAVTSRLKVTKQRYSTYRYKQMVKIQGQIQAKNSTGTSCTSWCFVNAPGDSVRLMRRIGGTKNFKQIGIAYGNSTGRFTFKSRSKGNAVYRLVYSGNSSVGVPAASSKNTIRGSRNLHASARKAGRKVYMRGNVDPGWNRKRVTIMRKSTKRGSFHVFKRVRTGKHGKFQVRLPGRLGGYYYYRAVVPASSPRWSKGVSRTWSVRTVRY